MRPHEVNANRLFGQEEGELIEIEEESQEEDDSLGGIGRIELPGRERGRTRNEAGLEDPTQDKTRIELDDVEESGVDALDETLQS